MLISFGMALMLIGSPQAAPTQSEQPQAVSESGTSSTDNQRLICRRERVVGSNRAQRICQTRQQWAEQSDQSRQMMDKVAREQPLPVLPSTE